MVGVVSKHEILPNMACASVFQVVGWVKQVLGVVQVVKVELEVHSSFGNTGVLVLKEIHKWHVDLEGGKHHQNIHFELL